MSTKGSTKSNQSGLRNSFHILGTLDDHLEKSTPKSKPQNAVNDAPKAAAPAVKEAVSRPVPSKPASTNGSSVKAAVQQQKKEIKSEAKKAVQAGKNTTAAPAEASTYKFVNLSLYTPFFSSSPLIKMLVFALLMLILPLGAYYWSVHQAGLDLGEIKSALIAVLIVNLLLFVYIVLAFLEDSKSQKAKKD